MKELETRTVRSRSGVNGCVPDSDSDNMQTKLDLETLSKPYAHRTTRFNQHRHRCGTDVILKKSADNRNPHTVRDGLASPALILGLMRSADNCLGRRRWEPGRDVSGGAVN